jgi:hypothetical protein
MFMSTIEAKLTPIYYKGGGPALNDIIAGHIDVYCDPATGPTPYIQAGTIPGFAITSKKRVSTLPNLPTSAEAGVRRHNLVRPVRAAQHAETDRGCARRSVTKGAQGSCVGQSLRRAQHEPGGAGTRGPRHSMRSSGRKPTNGRVSSSRPASNRNSRQKQPD